MFGLSETQTATVVAFSVSLTLPLLLYGAWIMIDAEDVTWNVLTYHLSFILPGLALTTIPLVFWMLPRLFEQFGDGLAAVHAFFGFQAYAMLAFGATGIVRIFRAKWEHDLYHDYDEDVLLDEIGDENMRFWRRRLRIGVFGYTFFWILAYVIGIVRYLLRYSILG
ncbi:DUF7321 family protein [Halomarina oriensis]|uniref:DUF7321 domain-containing protein n=1 Tax=Halomarina oriensis TaxID=671145 RepID=A0A6B0GKJ0_9EURY|nr:hypothetical protein [Halomarina oriensis]MWG33303.1 hypothetical protein [Halomarina oriensis]